MIFISEELEHGLVSSLVRGLISLDAVPVDSLSKEGQAVYSAVEFLLGIKKKPPHAKNSVLAAACDVAGADKVTLRPYLDKAMSTAGGDESVQIIKKLREQEILAELSGVIGNQMATRSFDPSSIISTVRKVEHDTGLVPLCDLLPDGEFPPEPRGFDIRGLPILTEATGGVMGVWAIGGKAKLGKSTLAMQIALGAPRPVLYYDMENGLLRVLYRLGQAYQGDKKRFKEDTEHFYLKKSAKTLEADINAVNEPVLVVIDSLNKLPRLNKDRRTSVDEWLARFEALAQEGHAVILISELNGFGGYKETGEIEYTVDLGITLEGSYDAIEVNIVANRNRPHYGNVCDLRRVNSWGFKEAADLGHDEDSGL